jgi:hypothetical protein
MRLIRFPLSITKFFRKWIVKKVNGPIIGLTVLTIKIVKTYHHMEEADFLRLFLD